MAQLRLFITAQLTFILIVTGTGTARTQTSPPLAGTDPGITQLIASISEERLRAVVERLASFGTRHTLSDPTSHTRGIGAARRWIYEEFRQSSSRLQVSYDTHQIPKGGRVTRDVELQNVVATLPGRSARRIYVVGHYDSLNLGPLGALGMNSGATRLLVNGAVVPATDTPINQSPATGAATAAPDPDPNIDAPGANDNGSGTALMMELAHVFGTSGIEFDATLVFMAVAGEEQGLHGSRAHARAAKTNNISIQAVFNNDIVGGVGGRNGVVDGVSVRLYSEGPADSPSRALALFTRRIASRYVPSHELRLMALRDRFLRASDHTSFNLEGFAAVGFRESREDYAKQHNANDTIESLSIPYLGQNARANAAAVATLALAPPPPVITNPRGQPLLDRRPSGYDARLQWVASPGAAGYRIVWRHSWASDWEHEMHVGNVTEFVLPGVVIDDYIFGVAAIGPKGHESTAVTYVPLPPSY